MNTLLKIVTASFLVVFFSAAFAEKNLWDIDKTMKFHLGYVPTAEQQTLKDEKVISVPALNLKGAGLPDITNINLANILKLGFPFDVPAHPEQYNFYLKLFQFPKKIDPAKTTGPILKFFLLDQLDEGDTLRVYASKQSNILVKLGFSAPTSTIFSPEHPYPQFLINPTDPHAQSEFNYSIPFFSLYVKNHEKTPAFATVDDKAAWTTQAVLSFQKELLNIYQHKLTSFQGKDSESYYYFIDEQSPTYPNHLVVIKMAQQPLIFKNWRELPMPQDEQKIFVTSLLLTYRSVYTLKNPMIRIKAIPAIETPAFNKLYKPLRTQVFELSSIVYLTSNDIRSIL